jgi:hypothetical protein
MNDAINAAFELGMALMLLLNVRRLWLDRCVHGVSLWAVAWPTAWGCWNLYYYPSLGQWASFAGGVFVVAVNIVWIALAIRFSRAP